MHTKQLDQNYIKSLFLPLLEGKQEEFFKHVANDVNWRVMGTHPLAGTYLSREKFLDSTFRRLNKVLKEGVLLKLVNAVVENNTAVVELQAITTQKNGKPFNNELCWILTFDSQLVITQVRAYLDSHLVKEAIENNE